MTTATPSRKEAREAARAERRRREEEEALQARRKRRLAWAGGIGVAAIVLVAVVIAIASGGDSDTAATGGSGLEGTAAVKAEFAGIPQNGNELGAANAPATMMVFADMQCPFCAEWETAASPDIVERYVKSGKLKMVFQPISIVGPDSDTGAKAVAAAALQDKMFQYSSVFYRNQGEENTGYVTGEFIEKIARATPGLDFAKWKSDLASPEVGNILARAQRASETGGIDSTPSFLVAKRGEALERLEVSELKPEAFYGKLDALTG